MTRTANLTLCLFAGFLTGMSPSAKADVIATVAEYNGPAYDFTQTYPLASVLIGTFTFSIPTGVSIVGATISGTFGNNDVEPDTALSDYYVNGGGIQVAGCDSVSDPCFSGNGFFTPTAWSYTFTAANLTSLTPALKAGSLDFTVVQDYPFSVQTGVTTLDLQVSPEPGTFAVAGCVLLGLALLRRPGAR